MSAVSGVPAPNPNARNRARRKDPFRRAVGAPAKKPTPNLCPLGKCEHAGLLHKRFAQKLAPPRLRCEVCDCEEESE